jgi:hypothetical protein
MTMPRISVKSRLAASAAVATLAGGLTLATAGPASAYGNGEVYQVELSANISGASGGGVWLWFGLSSDHTGDYHGSDCGHRNGPATSDGGTVTWQLVGSQVVISGVVLNGLGGFPGPGHRARRLRALHRHGRLVHHLAAVHSPGIGSSQLQVAP